jgi:type III pantothenate kinase
MAVTLCFDFGNTRRKVAVFENADLREAITLSDDNKDTVEKLIKEFKPVKSILSSVVNHNPELEELLLQNTRFHKLNHQTRLALQLQPVPILPLNRRW